MDTIAQKPKTPRLLLPLTFAAIVGAQLFSLLYLAVPALIAAALLYENRPILPVLFAVLGYGCALLFYGDGGRAVLLPALMYTSLGLFQGIAIWQLQKRKQGGFHTAAVASAIGIVLLYLATCLDGILAGAGAFAAVAKNAEAAATEMYNMIAASGLPEAELFLETYGPMLESMGDMAVLLLVPMLCVIGSMLGLCNTLLFRLFIRRDREAFGFAPLHPLREWSIPQEYSLGITVLLIGSMILMFMETEFSDAITTTVITLVSIPLTAQAVALIDWFIVRKGKHVAFKRTLMVILIVGMYQFISNIIVTLGIFEQIFHVRAHFAAMDMGPKPPASKQEDTK